MAISGSIIPSFSASKIGGGIGSRVSNFIRPKISNLASIIETISKPIGGSGGGPKISSGLSGFAETFGSPKTEKVIRRGVSTLRNVLIETYDLAKILVATVKKTGDKLKGGLFGGGKGGGGGLLGGLAGGALAIGVLAVLKKVIIGAAIFMAGKWLLEMTGILKNETGGEKIPIEEEKKGLEKYGFNDKDFNLDPQPDGTYKVTPKLNIIEGDSQDGSNSEEITTSDSKLELNDSNDTPTGVFRDGGIIKGKSHKQGGENINVEDGEAVIPKKTVDMLGIENILRLIKGTNKKNVSSSKTLDLSEDKPEGVVRGLSGITDAMTFGLTDFDKFGSGLLQFNPIGGGEDKKWGTDGIDGSPGVDGIDGIDGSSGSRGISGKDGIDSSSSINYIQSQVTKLIASEPQKKDPKTVVLPIDSNQSPIELPQPQPREQIVNPNGSAGNAPDIPFPSSTKSDSFGAFETRMIYNIVGG